METRYNIYFAGQLREGQDPASVRTRIARLFNADEATLQRLFSGGNQLVKRNCDKATALRYKQAIENAGAVPVIKVVAADAATPAPGGNPQPLTAAQKIAALAAAPDPAPRPGTSTAPAPSAPVGTGHAATGIQLAPAGTAVLRPEERQPPAVSKVRTPQLDLDSSGRRLSEIPPPPPPAPDTSHLSEGPVGELLPTLPATTLPLSPDTSAIALSPDGTDLSDCIPRAPAAPDLDLSGIALAPPGADVLEAQYRNRHDTPAPSTDHLALQDQ